MSKDHPYPGGSKKQNEEAINSSEKDGNSLSSEVIPINIYDTGSVESYNGTTPNNAKPIQRHLNGVQVHMVAKGCKDLLTIHRCLSDGKLIDFTDDTEETVVSRSLSSSDCCMNGSIYLETRDTSCEMAGADSKNIGGVKKNKQNNEKHGKSWPVNGEKQQEANGASLNDRDNLNYVVGNDIVRPKTWSRKLAEKCKFRKDVSQDNGRSSTQNMCNGNLKTDDEVPKTKTCRAFEHDRALIQQQRRGLVNGNSDTECKVLEIPLSNYSRLLNTSDVLPAAGCASEGNKRTGTVVSDKSNNELQTDSPKDMCNALQNTYTTTTALLVAPLALPEDTSDDEIGAVSSRSSATEAAGSNSNSKSASDNLECEFSESNAEFTSESLSVCDIGEEDQQDHCSDVSRTECNITRAEPSIGFAEYPESIFSRAPDEDDTSLTFGHSSPLSTTMSGASPCDTQTLIERRSTGGNDAMNAMAQNLQQVSSSSLDSLEEIGDYIETDLPPNRFAFFSRGSSSSTTTEEDEGCGDEVLPNNDEESDNETIDPLNSYHNPGLPNLPNVQYNNKPLSFPVNFNRDRCQNTGVSLQNHTWGQNSTENSVAPSKLVNRNDQNCDKKKNASVDTEPNCDKCIEFSSDCNVCESDEQNDDMVESRQRNRIQMQDMLDRNPKESAINESNDGQRRLNSLGGVPRLSSSDSDPAGMVFMISDDSENVSPEYESGMEYVFPTIGMSASFSGAMGGAYNHQQPNVVFGDPSMHPRNHTSSLDFDRDDEILHYPFFVRRARSLDQEIDTRCRIQNRLSDIDHPNIPVASSNLQHHESNQNQKVFEKSAFEPLVHLQTWDSSDEDENNRVPDIEPSEEEPLDQIFENMENQLTGRQAVLNRLSSEFSASNISMPEDEPIYEEIDDLLVLMDEVCSEGEPDNLQPVCNAISKLRRKRRHRSPVSDVEKVMIWNEYEAYVVQVKQIGMSACGPTAVLNVLKAFDFQVEKEEVCQTITSNMRMEAAPIPYYLFSRSAAGTTAQALVEGVASVTRGAIKGRFFHFYPQRDVQLTKWLGHWMKKGAVPVATLNLQRGVKPGWTIPDAWHHQMVYGVSSKGVYLTNPLEIVPENVIMDQLTSDSVLLVRRHDIVSRFRDWCPLNEILKQRDNRWRTMNVLGQVVHMLREYMVPQDQIPGVRAQLTSHISIPAVYKAGIILFTRANTDTYEELLKAPELPIKETDSPHPS